jgi:hypothetical protein
MNKVVIIIAIIIYGCTNAVQPSKKTQETNKVPLIQLCLGYQSGWSKANSKRHTDSLKKIGVITTHSKRIAKVDIDYDATTIFNRDYEVFLTHCAIGENKEERLFKIRLVQEPMETYYPEIYNFSFEEYREKMLQEKTELFNEIVNKYNAKIIKPFECYIYDSVLVKISIDTISSCDWIDPTENRFIEKFTSENRTKLVKGIGMRIVVDYTDLKLYELYLTQLKGRSKKELQRRIRESKEKL